jgi:hypothetical protein
MRHTQGSRLKFSHRSKMEKITSFATWIMINIPINRFVFKVSLSSMFAQIPALR